MNDSYDDESPFWGQDETPTGQMRRIGRDVTSQISRIVHDHQDRHHFDRTRQHRTLRTRDAEPLAVSPYDYDLDDGYAGLGTPDHSDDAIWDDVDVWIAPEYVDGRRANSVGVDPRLLRLGAIAAAAVVILPIAVTIAAGGHQDDEGQLASAVDTPAVVPQELDDPESSTIPITAAVVPVTAALDDSADAGASGGASSFEGVQEKGAPTAASAPVCAGQYTVVAGDYWLRLSGESGVDVDAWLAANDASLETSLFPGDELCIPEGATAPPPPTTTGPPTTAAPTTVPPTTAAPATPSPTEPPTTEPRTTAPPTTAPPTTAPPTTAPPTTAPTSPPTTPPPGVPSDVEGIIRHVFPDSEEDYAITIARRESNLDPRAYNGWCCYGLFQLYYDVHRSWLDDIGIDSAGDLLDPYLNTVAAYTLWQRSGWSAWSTHG